MTLALRDFQLDGQAHLETVGRGILADDPGLGKTLQALMAARGRTLIVAPAALLSTWADELAQWWPLMHDSVAPVMVSYHSLCAKDYSGKRPKMTDNPSPAFKGRGIPRWDTVICDEAHYLKGRHTKWTNAVQRLPKDRLFLLTGTPLPNWAYEVFTLLKLCGPPGVDLGSYWRWVDKWFVTWQPEFGNEYSKEIGKLHAHLTWRDFAVGNQLDRLMLRRKRDDVLKDLPPITDQTIACPMTPGQRKAYEELEAQFITWVAAQTMVQVFGPGGLQTKLMQTATALDTLTKGRHADSGKLDVLAELLAERKGSPTFVVTVFRETALAVERLCEALGLSCGVMMGGTADHRHAFQNRQLDVLVGTIDRVAEGLTLTAADTCIQVERSWRPLKNTQVRQRIHRIGQTRPCLHINLVSDAAVEHAQLRLLAQKMDQQDRALTAQAVAREILQAA